jgi:hypothetical protein
MSKALLDALAKEAKDGRIPWLDYSVSGGCPSCGPELDADCSECYREITRYANTAKHAANPESHREGCSVPLLVQQYAEFIGLDLE